MYRQNKPLTYIFVINYIRKIIKYLNEITRVIETLPTLPIMSLNENQTLWYIYSVTKHCSMENIYYYLPIPGGGPSGRLPRGSGEAALGSEVLVCRKASRGFGPGVRQVTARAAHHLSHTCPPARP